MYIAKFNGTCIKCNKPIIAHEHAITWVRRRKKDETQETQQDGAKEKKDWYHIDCGNPTLRGTLGNGNSNGNSNGSNGTVQVPDALGGGTVPEECMMDGDKANIIDVDFHPVEENTNGTTKTENKASRVQATESSNYLQGLAQALGPYLADIIKARVDEGKVSLMIQEAIGKLTKTTKVEYINVDGKTIDMGRQHKQFPELLRQCHARKSNGMRLNFWLRGPAGSGKTSAVQAICKAMSYETGERKGQALEFRYNGALDSPYGLTGYMDGAEYRRTPYRDTVEFGGGYLYDECDGSDNRAILPFNGHLAGTVCNFPDGMVPRHPDCIIFAAANTLGEGATSEYCGRLRIDKAFLDRFVPFDWEIDEGLETDTCGNPQWAEVVQKYRKAIAQKGIKALISPRASYDGASLLAVGIPQATVEKQLIKSKMTANEWASIGGAN